MARRAASFSGTSRSLSPLPRTISMRCVAPRGGRRQRHQLGDAQAGRVEHLEQASEPRGAQPFAA